MLGAAGRGAARLTIFPHATRARAQLNRKCPDIRQRVKQEYDAEMLERRSADAAEAARVKKSRQQAANHAKWLRRKKEARLAEEERLNRHCADRQTHAKARRRSKFGAPDEELTPKEIYLRWCQHKEDEDRRQREMKMNPPAPRGFGLSEVRVASR